MPISKFVIGAVFLFFSIDALADDYSLNDYDAQSFSEQSVDSSDPCVVVLCMYGKVVGSSGGSACSSPEKTFFKIIKKKKGSFLPSHTADARKAFISKCASASNETISQIIKSFGKVRL